MKIHKADDVPLADGVPPEAKGVEMRLLIHRAEGAPNFYMRQFTVAPEGFTPRHRHDWEHEVYVLSGRGEACTPDGPHPLKAGDCIFVPPREEHQFRNTGDEPLKFLCLVPRQE